LDKIPCSAILDLLKGFGLEAESLQWVKILMPILKLDPIHDLGEIPDTKLSTLPNGVAGNLATVDFMIQMARERSRHPLVRELALRILQHYRVKSQDYYNEARAIGDYIHKNVRYVRDIHNVETVHDPLTLIDQMIKGKAQGDCDDMALLIAALLLSIGHQPYFAIVKYIEGETYQHIYTVVYEKNHNTQPKRLVLDAILKRKPIGSEVNYKDIREIKV